MAGGIGSRFWPASRTHLPKQFLDILGTGKTLIQSTYERFLNICPKENIFILTNKNYMSLVKEQLPDLTDDQILGEPARKNTAPCIAYVSNKIKLKDPKANIIVAPSDHIVLNENEFIRIANKAIDFAANNDALITLGIVPTRPDTGYGYIQYKEKNVGEEVFKVKTFTEKPNLETAKKFIDSGDFLWNAGIFIWSVNSIVAAFEQHLPDIAETFNEVTPYLYSNKEGAAILKAFTECKSISIDYGIMEKAENVYIIPADFGWSDLGTWKSLHAEKEKDENNNATSGTKIRLYNAKNNMISVPDEKLVIIEGIENFIIVDTDDVLLICNKNNEQKIKEFTSEIKKSKQDRQFL